MDAESIRSELRLGIPVPENIRAKLREIRLDHYREFLTSKRCERFYRAAGKTDTANWFRMRAGVHMRAVQCLNEFFPLGDYAEHDHESSKPVVSHETLATEHPSYAPERQSEIG